MISYLGSLVQFSPAPGRAGRCRQILLCVGSTRRVPATLGLPHSQASVLSPSTLLRLPAALYGAGLALPLQYSCLENPMDREAWWATVHTVTKNQMQLSTAQPILE